MRYVHDYRVIVGSIGKTVSVSRFQGIEGGAFTDRTELRMIRKDGKPFILRLDAAEVRELIGLLATAVNDNIPVRY